MIQNIKVDIVYFKTATDFEFEFNLGSCCHMRLLNDKVKDRKSFVNSLARAVSRSQIIISCGPLFGDEGLISTVATAIGHGLETVNNKAYGLSSSEKIEIIQGSVPLITPEGYFGGCIIESGSQTIIVLTENRTIRKSIMKNLVHPYIEELSIMNSTQKTTSGSITDKVRPVVEEKPKDETEESAPQDTEHHTQNEPEQQTQDETEPDTANVTDDKRTDDINHETDEIENASDDGEHNISFDFAENENESLDATNDEQTDIADSESENENDAFISEKELTQHGKVKGINISILIITAVLLLAILALCYFLIFIPAKNGVSTVEYFKQIFGNTSYTGSV